MKYISLKNGKYLYMPELHKIVNQELFNNNFDFQKLKLKKNSVIYPFGVNRPQIRHFQEEIKKLNRIVFEITEKCNLKCKYCLYGSNLYNNWRPVSTRSISLNIIHESLMKVWNLIKDRSNREFNIGFYGGEPLIEFDKINKTVAISKKIFNDIKLTFFITTNATLINEEMVDFFHKNNFQVLISLDGPRENNDAKRIFPDAKGTYDVIMEKLKLIGKNKDFYKNNVSFSAVLSKDLDIYSSFKFFESHPLVKNNDQFVSFVNEKSSKYYFLYPYDKLNFATAMRKGENIFYNKKLSKIKLNSADKAFNKFPIEFEKKLWRNNLNILGASCLFSTRLFVETNGNFTVCESICKGFSIGNYKQGFNFRKMQKLLCDYLHLRENKCLDCEARHFCSPCYAHFYENGKLFIDDAYCNIEKKSIMAAIEDFITLKENIIERKRYQ